MNVEHNSCAWEPNQAPMLRRMPWRHGPSHPTGDFRDVFLHVFLEGSFGVPRRSALGKPHTTIWTLMNPFPFIFVCVILDLAATISLLTHLRPLQGETLPSGESLPNSEWQDGLVKKYIYIYKGKGPIWGTSAKVAATMVLSAGGFIHFDRCSGQ